MHKLLYCTYSKVPEYSANSIAVINQCRALAPLCDLGIVCAEGNTSPHEVDKRYTKANWTSATFLSERTMRSDPAYSQALSICVKEFSPDAIYSRDIKACLLLAREGIPSIYEMHQLNHPNPSYDIEFKRALHLLSSGDELRHVVCVAAGLMRDAAMFGVPFDKMTVLRSGVDAGLVSSSCTWTLCSGAPLKIGYVGSLQAGKGLPIFFEVARALSHDLFYLVGGNAERELRGLPKNVTYIPWIEHSEISSAYGLFNVALLPFETQKYKFWSPLKLFEYLATGKVIIASRVDGVDEVIEDGVNGFLVDPGDVDGFCKKIELVRRDPDLACKMSKSAIKTAKMFTWEVRAKSIERLAAQCFSGFADQ